MTYIMLPFMVLPLQGTMRGLDPNVLRAASLCGANRLQVFTRIFLPLVASGNGVTVEEVKAILLHATAYCDIPAGLDAFKAAHEVLVKEGAMPGAP